MGGEQIFSDGSKVNICGGGISITTPLYFPHTKITVNSGSVVNIQGGNEAGGIVDTAEIIINGGIVKNVNGAGAAWCNYYRKMFPNTVYNVKMTINGGIVQSCVYGGGVGADSNVETNVELNINDGAFYYVTIGGSNGNTNAGTLNMNGGTIQILQSTNRGSVKNVVYNIKNGTIEKAYLGGEAASDVSGTLNSMQCNISGGSITNLYLGTDGSTAKSSTEEYIERKLDISKVTGTYVDGVIKNAEDGILEKLVKQ